MMMFRGVRGATLAEDNTREAIMTATEELMRKLIQVNDIQEEYVASVIFTSTPDLTAAFPAAAARHIGWTRVALLGAQEIDTPEGMKRCIRVLIHWNTERPLDAIQHVYMRGTEQMRPDLYPNNKVAINE
jgi:chorismate mutase